MFLKLLTSPLPEESLSTRKILFFMFVAYLFGVLVRAYMLYQVSGIDALWYEGHPIPLWTSDAGRYGYYAKALLQGETLPYAPDYLTGHLIALVVRVTTAPLDWVMVVLPILLAPLIVIPIIEIGRAFKQPYLGFLAAIFSVAGYAFYMRSTIGYMDTDGINLFLYLCIYAFFIRILTNGALLSAAGAATAIVLFKLWYHSALPLIALAIAAYIITFLMLDRFNRKHYAALILTGLALLPVTLNILIPSLLLAGAVLTFIERHNLFTLKAYWGTLSAAVVIFFIFGHPEKLTSRALSYLSKSDGSTFTANGITYHFQNALSSVSEAISTPLWEIESLFFFVVGTVGYLLALLAYRRLLVTLPLFLIGMGSAVGGYRFAMYATPILALGTAYLLLFSKSLALRYLKKETFIIRFSPQYLSLLILVLLCDKILDFNTSKFFSMPFLSKDLAILEQLSDTLKPEDRIVTWWDFGWPLWYYTGHQNTLVDNGAHGGPDSHAIAKILTSDNPQFIYNASNAFSAAQNGAKKRKQFILPYLLNSTKFTPEKLFQSLTTSNLKQEHDGDVYILLHYKMLNFFSRIAAYSDYNFTNGLSDTNAQLHHSALLKPFDENYSLISGLGFVFDSSTGLYHMDSGPSFLVNQVMLLKGNTPTKGYLFDGSSPYYFLISGMDSIFLSESALDSFFIRTYVFDDYNQSLFEKFGEGGKIKIFKLKPPPDRSQ